MTLDNGAYISWGATTPTVAMMPSSSLYRVPNVNFKATCVYTNNTYSQAMRGYGTPQVTFAIESSMDELAEKAGMDPLRFPHAERQHRQRGDAAGLPAADLRSQGVPGGSGRTPRLQGQARSQGHLRLQGARRGHGLPAARGRRRQDLQVRRLRHLHQDGRPGLRGRLLAAPRTSARVSTPSSARSWRRRWA